MAMESKELYVELGKKIKDLRAQYDVTQEELAKALDMQRTSVTNIEAGNQAAPLHVYYQVCSFFREDVNDFLSTAFKVNSQNQIALDTITSSNQVSDANSKLAEALKKMTNKLETA